MASEEVVVGSDADRGITSYYQSKLDGLQLTLRERQQNLSRLQAQRNELNAKGMAWLAVRLHGVLSLTCVRHNVVRGLRQELALLQEPASYVGEVVKQMGKDKVLVKVGCGVARVRQHQAMRTSRFVRGAGRPGRKVRRGRG